MIQAKFGLPDIAVRTLEVYTTATLEATLADAAAGRARVARDDGARRRPPRATDFRRTVYDDPRFLRYFRARDAGGRARRAAHRQPAGAARVGRAA